MWLKCFLATGSSRVDQKHVHIWHEQGNLNNGKVCFLLIYWWFPSSFISRVRCQASGQVSGPPQHFCVAREPENYENDRLTFTHLLIKGFHSEILSASRTCSLIFFLSHSARTSVLLSYHEGRIQIFDTILWSSVLLMESCSCMA